MIRVLVVDDQNLIREGLRMMLSLYDKILLVGEAINGKEALEILENIKKVIKGKDEVIEKVLIATLSKGHILIEDVPGVGKTTLAKALAQSMDLSYKRVQFTPDLMPSDIIGINIYDKNTGNFSFKKGPIFNHIFLNLSVFQPLPSIYKRL